METPAPKLSRIKKIFRRTVFVLAVFITLVALLIAEEDWRGSRAWHNYKSEMEAKGERFDSARLIPPQVPDDENFAACEYLAHPFAKTPGPPEWTNIDSYLPTNSTLPYNLPHHPLWPYGLSSDLTNWASAFQKGTAPEKMDPAQAAAIVLDHLKVCEPVLAELRAASQKRFCRFNVPYEDWFGAREKAQEATFQHFALVKGLFRVLVLRAEAELVVGHTEQAMEDIRMMFRLEDGLKDEPLLISQLVSIASAAILVQPIAEGLAERRWSDTQLRFLQVQLGKIDLLASAVRAFYGERDILANPSFDGGMLPLRGWNRLEQLSLNQAFKEALLPRINLSGREVSPAIGHACDLAMSNYPHSAILHHTMFAAMMLPATFRAPEKAAAVQTDVDLMTVACALERYRLADGNYPDQLTALSPRFITTMPHDIINGQPLKYRRTPNGKFILYSVGWNEKDDGGVIATNKDGHVDRLRGDWVLQYPE